MKISASFLGIKENIKENISLLTDCDIDYLHLDIMDGEFVPNKTWSLDEIKQIINNKKPLDIHLMVKDIEKYIEEFKSLHPLFITIHYELSCDMLSVINQIKKYGIKVGMAMKPETNVERLLPFLGLLDMVLVMSVAPGEGGQDFLTSSVWKIAKLIELRDSNQYHYEIAVDGGINERTIKLVEKADIVVIGSYITSGDYKKNIENIRFLVDE